MTLAGTSVVRTEDERFLTGRATYVENLDIPGALHATYVRSTLAHARLRRVDVDAARASPGVVAVLTAADLDLEAAPPSIAFLNQAMARPWLAADTVRFVGEALAVVLSEIKAQGEDAGAVVVVEYDPLPVVIDPETAGVDGAPLLFAEAGTNVALDLPFGRDESLFDDCEVVVRQRIVNQRLAPCPLEGRSAAASWGTDGRLTHWSSTQSAHAVRDRVASLLGVEPVRVRVIAPDVGGAFGSKIGLYPEEALLGWLARWAGRPVRWTETRSESMVSLGHGRAQVQFVEIGGTRAGRVQAYRLTVVQDAGAYPSAGAGLPVMTRMMLSGTYDIARAEFNSTSVVTNTTPTVAYRGAGRPEAIAAVERAMDCFAAEIAMDPAEVRRLNLIPANAFPYTSPVGTVYDTGDYESALDLVLRHGDYAGLRAEQVRRRALGGARQLGVGLALYVEITSGGAHGFDEWGAVAVNAAGRAVVRSGSSPHGQGHETGFAVLAADALGLPLTAVEVVFGDTDRVPRGQGTMASRSLQAGGVAVARAAAQVVDQARAVAARLLDAPVEPVVIDAARSAFHLAGRPEVSVGWAEVAAAAVAAGEALSAEVDYRGSAATFPFGAHLAVVEVDVETGRVELVRMVAVDDAGRLLNPALAEGQVHGGLAQGIAQALFEEVRFDAAGRPLTSTLADYGVPTAGDLPGFETHSMQTPTPVNELGAKGIGESGAVGAPAAVQNAVVDALAHLGVRHIDMPLRPERVWQALASVPTP